MIRSYLTSTYATIAIILSTVAVVGITTGVFPQESPEGSPNGATKKDESSLQTYRSREYGFAFDYPENVELEGPYRRQEDSMHFYLCKPGCGMANSAGVFVKERVQVSSLQDLKYDYRPPISARVDEIDNPQKKSVMISGKQWLHVKERQTDEPWRENHYRWLQTIHHGNLITIVSRGDLYDLIRSTIRLSLPKHADQG